MVLAWPVLGIKESMVPIGDDELAAAAARTVTLWAEQSEEERFSAVRAPQPPAGGWFEQDPPAAQ